MTNKKIAIIVCAFPPQGGGIGNNAYYHARELTKLGYQITVFTPDFSGGKKIISDNYQLEYLPVSFELGKAGFLFSLLARLKDFDIVHLYYPFFGTDLLVWWFKFFHRSKKLIVHYQMDPVGFGWQKIFFKLYAKIFFPLVFNSADKIIALSLDHARHSYLKKYLAKVTVIPNGIGTEIFKPQVKDEKLMTDLAIDNQDQTVIFVGGLDKQHYFKGIDILFEAFKNISAKLLIVGDGELKEKYKNLAKELRIENKVIFTGWIKNEDLPRYYALADVFVLPSTARTESFGIVVAEAQACGLPAIVSAWPGIRKTIKEGETGWLVEPKNPIDLADKISKLLADYNLRKKMSEVAIIRAGRKYSWKKIADQLAELYIKL